MTGQAYDWPEILAGLDRHLRLRSIPIGMKLFETVEEMEAIPKIRRPTHKHTTDQIVAQARQLGWTLGITLADLVGAQCGAVIGLHPGRRVALRQGNGRRLVQDGRGLLAPPARERREDGPVLAPGVDVRLDLGHRHCHSTPLRPL